MRLRSWGYLFAALLVLWGFFALLLSVLWLNEEASGLGAWHMLDLALPQKGILVLYLFAASDPEFVDNLKFFVSEISMDDDNHVSHCEYVFILQDYKGDGVEVSRGKSSQYRKGVHD